MNSGNLFSPEPANAWMKQAACSDIFPELFFYTDDHKANVMDVAYALTICAKCPVTAQCLDYALRTHDHYAVLGGTTPEQQRQIRRDMEIPF